MINWALGAILVFIWTNNWNEFWSPALYKEYKVLLCIVFFIRLIKQKSVFLKTSLRGKTQNNPDLFSFQCWKSSSVQSSRSAGSFIPPSSTKESASFSHTCLKSFLFLLKKKKGNQMHLPSGGGDWGCWPPGRRSLRPSAQRNRGDVVLEALKLWFI